MTIRVGELVSQLRSRSQTLTTRLGDVELILGQDENQPSAQLRVGDRFLPWGDRNTQMLAGFLKGPAYKYYQREPLDWQRQVIAHHTSRLADHDATWYLEGDSVAGIYHPGVKIIPLGLVAERIANVFDPDDEADVLYSPDQVEINVVSEVKTVTVPGIPGVADRPLEGEVEHPSGRKVGDLSAGGIRIITHPSKPERAPSVLELWKRLVCTNGMTRTLAGSEIKLRAKTVPEILDEIEAVARQVFEGLEESGRAIQHSAQIPVPGTVSDFIREVGREGNINAATILRLQERGAGLHENPSVYDVTQLITAMANEDGVPVATRRNLQAIGGLLTVDTARMVHRCTLCERPLAA